jgi:nucleotide-binding universal stress UspA family protein
MYKKILLPLALDQGHGPKAMELARKLKAEGGEIIAVHVLDQVPSFAGYYMASNEGNESREQEIKENAIKAIEERIGDKSDAEAVVLTGHPGRTITDYADKIGADCIIAGSHKPGMKDFFLGSTAARIMRYAHCSVHVLR